MNSQLAHDIYSVPRTEDVSLVENVSFRDMFFCDPVITALTQNGFYKPSPIQHKAIPLARCGFDLIVQSKSGTGKTLVFVVTALENLDLTIGRAQVIVLTPTREIALQVTQVFRAIGKHMTGLVVESFIGGLPLPRDIEGARKCHIAVGAPGRLRQLIELGHLKTDAVRLFILDEADQLMHKTFQNEINSIYWSLSEFKQTLALSATYPNELVAFLGKYMRSVKVVTPETNTVPVLQGLKQFVSFTRDHPDSLARLTDKEKRLASLLSLVKFNQCIVFSNYQTRAESTCNMLRCRGWSCEWMSGKQPQDQRVYALNEVMSGRCRLLVTTNLTARGIDAKGIDLVVNLDTPQDPRVYLHRMGRAGRYGSHGVVITILSRGQDLERFLKMLGRIDKSLSVKIIPTTGTYDLWSDDTDAFEELYGIEPKETDEVPVDHEFRHIKEPFPKKKIKSDKPSQNYKELENCENNLNKNNVPPDLDDDNFPSMPQQKKSVTFNNNFLVHISPDKQEITKQDKKIKNKIKKPLSFDSLKKSLHEYVYNKNNISSKHSDLKNTNNTVNVKCVKLDLKTPQVNHDVIVKDKKVDKEPKNALKNVKNQVRRFSYSEIAKGKRVECKPAQTNPKVTDGHLTKSPLKSFPTEKVSKHIEGITISDKAIDGFSKRMYSSVVKGKNTKIVPGDKSNSVDKQGVKALLSFDSIKNGSNIIAKINNDNSLKNIVNNSFENSKIEVKTQLSAAIKDSDDAHNLNTSTPKSPANSSTDRQFNYNDSLPISDTSITIDESYYERQVANLSLGQSMKKRSSRSNKPLEVTFEESSSTDSSLSEGEYIIPGSFCDNCSFIRSLQDHSKRQSSNNSQPISSFQPSHQSNVHCSEINRKNSNLFTMTNWLQMFHYQSSVIYDYVRRTRDYQHARNIKNFNKNQS